MAKRPWRHFEVRCSGMCEIEIGKRTSEARYEFGLVETGKQRVYAGVEVRIWNPAGGQWVGHDDWSPLEALLAASKSAHADGVKLMCSGLSLFFFQTGLSWQTPYGFYPWSTEPVLMMDPPEAPMDDSGNSPSIRNNTIN